MQRQWLLLMSVLVLLAPGAQSKHPHRARNGLITYSTNSSGSFQLWGVNPHGSSPIQLTFDNQGFELTAHPAWSPDGTRLAFTGMKGGSLNVWIRNADTSLVQLTTSVTPIASMVPAWMPDGKRIVFESNRAVPPEASTADDPYDLYSVEVTTGSDITRLTVSADGRTGGMGGKPSPCGKYLAFASDRDLSMPAGLFDLYVMNLSDAESTQASAPHVSGSRDLHSNPRRLTWGIANQFSRSWSPDSKQLVFNSQVGWTGTAADKVGAGRIMVIEADGSDLRPLTSTNDSFPPFSPGGVFPTLHGDVTPAWSPDGRRIAFSSQSETHGDFEIVTVRASDGKDRRRLTRVPHEQHVTVAWQPV